MPVYKEHHSLYSYGWALGKGTPKDVAGHLIDEWNKTLPEGEQKYDKTPSFIRAIGVLIYFRRMGIPIEQIPDSNPAGYSIDPLCLACGLCKE